MLQLRILFLLFLSPSIFAQSDYTLKILGTVQDAGSPHILCVKTCCNNLDLQSKSERKVSSIAIQNNATGAFYVFDATPDFPSQIKMMAQSKMPAGVFLTHAHIGHYTGLMFLGREGLGASKVPVFAMPKMKHFLTTNGPWSQLVALENIEIFDLQHKKPIKIEEQLSVMPFLVPHRDEYSETVGYEIKIKDKTIIFIPDINKWAIWEESIVQKIESSDLAFIDATFYDENEVKRDISEIPHPFVVESMEILKVLSLKDKSKVHFIHMNHTNPLLDKSSKAFKFVIESGFNVAEFSQSFDF